MDRMTTPREPVLRRGDRICASAQLQEGGCGVRFLLADGAGPAFVVRHAGRAVAYLNRCAHKQVELDWQAGEFFDAEHQHLVCATHGAMYDPGNGLCVGGPCRGASLVSIPVREADGAVWLAETVVTDIQ